MATEWVNVEVNLDPLLKPVQPVLDSIDTVLSLLIAILNIVQVILNVIKVFLVGLLDPIRLIVELIIQEIRNIINDLRNLGVYMTGDWRLIRAEDKYSGLLGGYQAYERRMLSRLLDRSDPNRPDFTSSSAVMGAFFYVGSGDIEVVVRVIRAIIKFFGRGDLMGRARPYGTPTAPTMKYGTAGAGIGAFRNLAKASENAIPDRVSISWQMPAGVGGVGKAFSPAPRGFLIHVSTIQDGFQVIGLSPKTGTTAVVENLPRVQAAGVDPTTNAPLVLYGGIADLGITSDAVEFNAVEQSGNAQAPLLVLQKDQNTALIKPSLLKDGNRPLVADTFFAKAGLLPKIGAGTTYTATFNRNDLPQHVSFIAGSDGFAVKDGQAEVSSKYWFRVRALTKDAMDAMGNGGTLANPLSVFGQPARLYFISREKINEATNGVLLPESTGLFGFPGNETPNWNSFTGAGGPGIAEFPTAEQATFIKSVQVAVAVAILCRADLSENDGTEFKRNTYRNGFGLLGVEGGGRDLLEWYGIKPVWFRGLRPSAFRRKMRNVLLRVSSDLAQKAGPPDSVVGAINVSAKVLLDFKWSDASSDYPNLTILQSLGVEAIPNPDLDDPGETAGVGGNPFCRYQAKRVLVEKYSDDLFAGPFRSPSFQQNGEFEGWEIGEGSADYSPIIYSDFTDSGGEKVEFIRNVFFGRGGEGIDPYGILAATTLVLQLAAASVSRPTGDTQWVAIRLLPQALVPLDDLLEKLDRFLQGILDGLDGIIDKIVAYIEAIQARIYQLQALLEKIRSLLRSLEFFRIPSVSALVLVESGTDGLIQGLVTSENKPTDPASNYGAGIAIVAGGIPTVLLEILALILSGGDE